MRIAKVIGTVTLSRVHPTLQGGVLKVCVPLMLDELTGEAEITSEDLVVYDPHGAGLGELIAMTEGGEAAQPFRPLEKPVDAYAAAILDHVNVNSKYLNP